MRSWLPILVMVPGLTACRYTPDPEYPTSTARCLLADKDKLDTVEWLEQEASNLCWAGSLSMVAKALGHPASQCHQASHARGKTIPNACCPGGKILPGCNKLAWPDFEKFELHADSREARPMPWARVQHEIGCRRIPYTFTWSQARGVKHMHVAVGYAVAGSQRTVLYLDPRGACKEGDVACEGSFHAVNYEDYDGSTGVFEPSRTYFWIWWKGPRQ